MAGLLCTPRPAGADDGAAQPVLFRRGASIQSRLGWALLRDGQPGRYAAEPFAGAGLDVPLGLVRDAKAAGFDFIRLAVDPGPFQQFTGAARDGLDATLLRVVRQIRGCGLAVIVDFAPNDLVAANDKRADVAALDGAAFRSYLETIRRTAHLLGAERDPRLALEFMNEPDTAYDPAGAARWQAMVEAMHAAARGQAPGLTLVASGGRSSARDALVLLDPAPLHDPNVLYTFHYYEPLDFTHQGVAGAPGDDAYRRYLGGLPYPSRTAGDVRSLVLANVQADRSLAPGARRDVTVEALQKAAAFVRGGYDRARIARDFDGVAAWASSHGIAADRVILGEFGVARFFADHAGADAASALGWQRDVRSEAEAHGFGWAVWALVGGTFMGITTGEDTTVLDPATLAALGLRAPGRPAR